MTSATVSRPALQCPHDGQSFRTAGGLAWHAANMHPAIVAGIVAPTDSEYATLTTKAARFAYERDIAATLMGPCEHCGKPSATPYCSKCSDVGHNDGARKYSDDARGRQMKADNQANMRRVRGEA